MISLTPYNNHEIRIVLTLISFEDRTDTWRHCMNFPSIMWINKWDLNVGFCLYIHLLSITQPPCYI